MSSPPKEELKAGHAPAVKVGGKRVVQHQHAHNERQSKSEREKEEAEFQTEKVGEQIMISGVAAKGDKDFPPEAVRVSHEKPIPRNEKPPHKGPHGGPNIHLKQPSKN